MKNILKSAMRVVLLALLSLPAHAYDVEIDGIYYNLENSGAQATATVTVGDNKYTGDVVIPKSVVVDGVTYSVTSFEGGCFEYCSSLTSVKIPSSVTSLGYGCFYECSSLTSIYIPSSVTSLGDGCFYECSSLTSIYIPSSVTSLGDGCFYECSSLASIELPSSVTSLGGRCFYGCASLTSIELPSSVTSLGAGCFSGCSSLESIVVDVNNPKYDSREDCNAIIETESNTMVTGCKNTRIPSSVISLGEYCFSNCSSLTSIELPSSVTSLETNCFSGCSFLESIVVDADNPRYDSRENCNAIIETESNRMVAGCKNTRIPLSVTSLGKFCFSGCSSLTSIEIPSSVTSLEQMCFKGCSSLKTVICNMETVIEDKSLFDDFFIASATLYVPKELLDTYKATTPWSDFGTIRPWTGEIVIIHYTTDDGFTYGLNIQTREASLNRYGGDATGVVVPEFVTYEGDAYKVTSLGKWCFFGCSSLVSIYIPSSVTSLGYGCFCCSSLMSIRIPSSVTSLGDGCFSGCYSLTSIEIPSSVTSLGEYCFNSCSSLNAIICKMENVIEDESIFERASICNATLYVPSEMLATYQSTSPWSGFGAIQTLAEIPEIVEYKTSDGLTYSLNTGTKEATLCYYRGNPTKVVIPEFVIYMGMSYKVTNLDTLSFSCCSSLTSIEIPASVTSLGWGCFNECSSLTSIEIPSSVRSLGDYSFSECSSLKTVICKMGYVIENESLFKWDTPISDATLYVLEELLDTYKSTSPWSGFGTILPLTAWDNYLTLSDAEVCKGRSVVLPVDMHNSKPITALQFELSLPTGVTLSDCLLTERKGGNHVVSYSQLANGNYQVVVFSLTNSVFLGSEGALVRLELDVDADMSAGDYPVLVKNIELTTSDEEAINPDDAQATLSVVDVKIGDANGDGKISITDAVAIVGHILGSGKDGFTVVAADVNGDGRISITDAVSVVNMILDGSASAKTRDTRAWLDPQ